MVASLVVGKSEIVPENGVMGSESEVLDVLSAIRKLGIKLAIGPD
jgi:hypothetical protein